MLYDIKTLIVRISPIRSFKKQSIQQKLKLMNVQGI